MITENEDVQAAENAVLESTSKVPHVYKSKLYKLKAPKL